MNAADTLTLRLSTEQMERFCRHLASHAPGSEQHLAALTALQTFIAACADAGEQARPVYQAIRRTLEQELEQARAALLQHNIRRLGEALSRHDVAAIAAIYRPLSRSGFWEVLTHSAATLDAAALSELAQWARQWVQEARRRGEEASGFPEAIDFQKAGLDVGEYTAMSDVQRFSEGLD